MLDGLSEIEAKFEALVVQADVAVDVFKRTGKRVQFLALLDQIETLINEHSDKDSQDKIKYCIKKQSERE